ncbi:MAG: hypothetical protein WBA97_35225 [Actinophytocola sp.]|uniref:hypothetical protein n=1 Tax=Actinophytocola sp. TaxID=1872138 RepID=UPI003C78F205
MRVGQVKFVTEFAWVPVVHFALSIVTIVDELPDNVPRGSRYNFTESGDSMLFVRNEQSVDISWTVGPQVATCRIDQFAQAAGEFATRVIADLDRDYPGFRSHPVAIEVLDKATGP